MLLKAIDGRGKDYLQAGFFRPTIDNKSLLGDEYRKIEEACQQLFSLLPGTLQNSDTCIYALISNCYQDLC
jgi:hypothetical protein